MWEAAFSVCCCRCAWGRFCGLYWLYGDSEYPVIAQHVNMKPPAFQPKGFERWWPVGCQHTVHLGRMRLVCRHRQEIRGRATSQVPSSAVGTHSCLLFVTKSDGIWRLERVRVDDDWPLWMVSRLFPLSWSVSFGPPEKTHTRIYCCVEIQNTGNAPDTPSHAKHQVRF